jgi:hypothetical protein
MKSILADIRKELKITDPKHMLCEILSQVKIDELIAEHRHKVYI